MQWLHALCILKQLPLALGHHVAEDLPPGKCMQSKINRFHGRDTKLPAYRIKTLFIA